MKKSITPFITIILAIFLTDSSCTDHSTGQEALSIVDRMVFFESDADTGILLLPGNARDIFYDIGKKEYPVRQKIRVTGSGVYPEPFSGRGEGIFRNFSFHIDDYLDSITTYKEKYSLVFMGDGSKIERNAFYRLSQDELTPFRGKQNRIEIPVKTNNLKIPEKGYLKLELQLYLKKDGRHPDWVQLTSRIRRILQAFFWLRVYTTLKPILIPPTCG